VPQRSVSTLSYYPFGINSEDGVTLFPVNLEEVTPEAIVTTVDAMEEQPNPSDALTMLSNKAIRA
jgi:hypothetical protein